MFSVHNHIPTTSIKLSKQTDVTLNVARFDLIDPLISGNKLYKLHYYLEQAKKLQIKNILTVGGAFSNHLAATARFCKMHQLNAIGLVRGENIPSNPSPTLLQCLKDEMKLHFISRSEFAALSQEDAYRLSGWNSENCIFIPEGGYGKVGSLGASFMLKAIQSNHPTHICIPVGTATTLAGFCLSNKLNVSIIGIPVLKGMTDISARLDYLCEGFSRLDPTIFYDYHFGGYARFNQKLLDYMNDLYHRTGLPTDFVYTAKMMFAIEDLIEKNYFPAKSRIICVHTGGLQGNQSLLKGQLHF